MPHWSDVEAAANLDVLCDVAEVNGFHQQVTDALIALALEVVLRHPEGVVTFLVHRSRDCVCLVEDGRKPLVGVEAVVSGRSVEAHVVQVYVACEQAAEPINH